MAACTRDGRGFGFFALVVVAKYLLKEAQYADTLLSVVQKPMS